VVEVDATDVVRERCGEPPEAGVSRSEKSEQERVEGVTLIVRVTHPRSGPRVSARVVVCPELTPVAPTELIDALSSRGNARVLVHKSGVDSAHRRRVRFGRTEVRLDERVDHLGARLYADPERADMVKGGTLTEPNDVPFLLSPLNFVQITVLCRPEPHAALTGAHLKRLGKVLPESLDGDTEACAENLGLGT
jgi:hypothetical protein